MHHSGVAVSVAVNSVSCITLVWQSLWWSIPSRASLWCGSLSGGQFRLVHPSGVAVSGPLAAREGEGLRIICRFMFSVVLLLSQLCGSYLFSSSGARLIHQPPMTSIVGDCLPAVCVDAHNLHVMFVSLTRRWQTCKLQAGSGISARERTGSDGSGIPARERTESDGSGIPARERTGSDCSGIPARERTKSDGSGIPARERTGSYGSGIPARERTESDGSGIPARERTGSDGSGIPARERMVVGSPHESGLGVMVVGSPHESGHPCRADWE